MVEVSISSASRSGTNAVVYDNQMNDPDDADATDAIEGGSIVIHK